MVTLTCCTTSGKNSTAYKASRTPIFGFTHTSYIQAKINLYHPGLGICTLSSALVYVCAFHLEQKCEHSSSLPQLKTGQQCCGMGIHIPSLFHLEGLKLVAIPFLSFLRMTKLSPFQLLERMGWKFNAISVIPQRRHCLVVLYWMWRTKMPKAARRIKQQIWRNSCSKNH